MPSLAISKFTVLLEPLWVSAEFLLLSTGPLLYIILSSMDAVAEMQRTNIAAHALRLYWWKSRKCRCRKALRHLALPRPGYRHGAPKPPALRFLCILPKNRPQISAVLTAQIALRVPL